MDPLDRVVAGLSCRQVLGYLGDFIDGDLPGGVLGDVRAHLAECQACDRFGGRISTIVGSLRGARAPEDVPVAVRDRLRERLRAASAGS
jgi:anti-sigma factor RsiW